MPRVPEVQHPLAYSSRRRIQRRWPLLLHVAKGAVHQSIIIPVTLHAVFAALVIYIDTYILHNAIGLPGTTIVPSLSIVVGLVLVFRNQTSYDRFWTGRNCLAQIQSSIRNIARTVLVCSSRFDKTTGKVVEQSEEEKNDTDKCIRCLIAILYAVKHALREEWSCEWAGERQSLSHALMPTTEATEVDPLLRANASSSMHGLNKFVWGLRREYDGLLPEGMTGFEQDGFALPLHLTVMVEAYFRRGVDRGWFTGPQTIQVPVQINNLIEAYGKMEVILTTAIPVGHRIHQRQVLALYLCIIPFAMVADLVWWAVPIVSMLAFTFYGIEAIGELLENPFGYDRNDIKMDAIIEDARKEMMVLLEQWHNREKTMFAGT